MDDRNDFEFKCCDVCKGPLVNVVYMFDKGAKNDDRGDGFVCPFCINIKSREKGWEAIVMFSSEELDRLTK